MKVNLNYLIIVVSIVVLALFLGCTEHPSQQGSGLMGLDANKTPVVNDSNKTDSNKTIVVKTGDQIAVNYTGRLENGSIFDTSVGRSPLEFTAGAGQMIKGFDSAVIGMKVGESKTVKLAPLEAYGEVNPNLVKSFDKNAFPDFNNLKVGMQLGTSTGLTGTVTKVTDQNATVDFNHELAGKTLIFEITVFSIN